MIETLYRFTKELPIHTILIVLLASGIACMIAYIVFQIVKLILKKE